MLTSMSFGVPTAGPQRDIKSGRGLPTAFLVISVMKVVKSNLGRQVSCNVTQRDDIYTQ
jgi:hypothetical protein